MKINPGELVSYGTNVSGYCCRYVGSDVEQNTLQRPVRKYGPRECGQKSNLAVVITLDRQLEQFEWCLVMSLDAYGVHWHNAQADVNIRPL